MKNTVWNIKSFEELSSKELYSILKARVEVFVVEQNCPYPELDGYDYEALHLWAERENEVVAYCRIFAQNIKYRETSIGRVLTTAIVRRENFGRQLMKYAIEIIETRFFTSEIRISAQDYLIRFYEEFGFKDTGKKYLEDEIPHTEMLRSDKEKV